MKIRDLIEFLSQADGDLELYAIEGSFMASVVGAELVDKSKRMEVLGISEITDAEDDRYLLMHVKTIPTPEQSEEYRAKWENIHENHPDRIIHCGHRDLYLTEKEYAVEMLKEAQEKQYNILRADERSKGLYGYVCYKVIDGIEIGYNPRWPIEQGDIELEI